MRQTVFKTHQQVLELKRLFFDGSLQDKKRALALCRAYETRNRLPVSIHLTALLTAAIQADSPANDVYAIRLGYSAALIRMVNEILDSAQTGKVAAPLHALAKMLDLPNTFVEARHAATHENIPSIYVLRELCSRALGWLYEKFWALQVPAKRKALDTDTKQTFSAWRRSRRAHVNGLVTNEEKVIIASLQLQYETDSGKFMRVIFSKNILVPVEQQEEQQEESESERLRKGEKSITLWGPALSEMGQEFLLDLCRELGQELDTTGWDMTTRVLDSRSQVLMLWLEYAIDRLASPSPDLVQQLGSRPRPWNAKGLAAYYRRFNDLAVHDRAVKMARFTQINVDLPQHEAPAESKWGRVDRWTPRPIGT